MRVDFRKLGPEEPTKKFILSHGPVANINDRPWIEYVFDKLGYSAKPKIAEKLP